MSNPFKSILFCSITILIATQGQRSAFVLKMESTKNINTKLSQFELMVEFMVANPDLSKGYLKTPEARRKSTRLWQNLAIDLNAHGPPMRDGNGWKKVWSDYKNHTKNKLRKNRQSMSGTGGGPSKCFSLTPTEEKVIELLELNSAVSGMSNVQSFGVNSVLNDQTNLVGIIESQENVSRENERSLTPAFEECNEADENDAPIDTPIPPRRMVPKSKTYLLEKQVNNQDEYQKMSCKLLKEINDNLSGILKYLRRGHELKEKKFRFQKEKFKFKKENSVQRNKIRIAKLELKKKVFELNQQINSLQ